MYHSRFRVSYFVFRVSGVGFRVPDFGFGAWGVWCFGVRVSCPGPHPREHQIRGLEPISSLKVPGMFLLVLDTGIEKLGYGVPTSGKEVPEFGHFRGIPFQIPVYIFR